MSHVVAFVKSTVSRGWAMCYKIETAQSALLKNLSFVIFQSGGGGGGLHLHFELARGSGRSRQWLGCFLIRHMTWASTVKKVALTSISRMRKMSLMSAEACFLCHQFCCSLP